jgi:hypothetical protein
VIDPVLTDQEIWVRVMEALIRQCQGYPFKVASLAKQADEVVKAAKERF